MTILFEILQANIQFRRKTMRFERTNNCVYTNNCERTNKVFVDTNLVFYELFLQSGKNGKSERKLRMLIDYLYQKGGFLSAGS